MSARNRTLKLGWRALWPVWLTLGGLFSIGAFGLWVLVPSAPKPATLITDKDLILDLTSLDPNKPSLFAYPLDSASRVEFFIERSARRDVTVAFASCRRCYRSGHYRRGTHILCGGCNQPMERALPGQAPSPQQDCTQIPIPHEATGNQLVVRGEAIRETFLRWYSPVLPHAQTPKHNDNDSR
jgi:uncharacterized membrane protein